MTGPLNADNLAQRLATVRVGRYVEVFEELDSTNRYVLAQAPDTNVDGWVVLAERQNAGRGRRGRTWHCPTGAGLLCTVGVEDAAQAIDPALLALVVPIALCDGLRSATAVRGEIKWPNDILVAGRKLAGVLIEAQHCAGARTRYALGFGVNCLQHRAHFPPELKEQATSLDLVCPQPIDRAALLCGILSALDGYLAAPQAWNAETICGQWRQRAIGLGNRVRLEHDGRHFTGNLVDIDPTAAVVVQLDEGGRRLFDAPRTTILEITP